MTTKDEDHAGDGSGANRPTAMRTHRCGDVRAGDVGHRGYGCAGGSPGAVSTASISPSWTCGTTPGVVQCVVDDAADARWEWVVAVVGKVRPRPAGKGTSSSRPARWSCASAGWRC